MNRHNFLGHSLQFTLSLMLSPLLPSCQSTAKKSQRLPALNVHESIPDYLHRLGGNALEWQRKIAGAANAFKEGDALLGLAAEDEEERQLARQLIANTPLQFVREHPLHTDALYDAIAAASEKNEDLESLTFADFKAWLMLGLKERPENTKKAIQGILPDQWAYLVKICSNEELIQLSSNCFHPLPNSHIGAKGYLGARIQPNSPTDNPKDIFWQVLSAFSYGVGDVVIGTNPVDSQVNRVQAIEQCLKDIVQTFGIQEVLPYCVLAHIDVQAKVEDQSPGSTNLWFQSLAGSVAGNQTFDLSLEKMLAYNKERKGKFGIYAETGQGADQSNGHAEGMDMLFHEARKYGFLKLLKYQGPEQTWYFVNDVAGFIGPEVFRTKEQLVRCCLEDLVMGKMQGLCIGLDVCTTLHMDVSLEDLYWCLDQIMPANPAYLMALPSNNDPMLSYLTTSYADHLRLRKRFGFKINEPMARFYQSLGVLDQNLLPGPNFGQIDKVYLSYCRRKGLKGGDATWIQNAKKQIQEVEAGGVPIAQGHGEAFYDMPMDLKQSMQQAYLDAKYCLWQPYDASWFQQLPQLIALKTQAQDRRDYVYHPPKGELLDPDSIRVLDQLPLMGDGLVLVSDGLNMKSLSDPGHALPMLSLIRSKAKEMNWHLNPHTFGIQHGRVRAGYHLGQCYFARCPNQQALKFILHLIGERPGTIHRNFSIYLTLAKVEDWKNTNIDHDKTRVISGISDTALQPNQAMASLVQIFQEMKGQIQ